MVGVSSVGMGLMFTEIYPGSISDSNIRKKSNVIIWVKGEHEIMSNKRFIIQDFCRIKDVFQTVYVRNIIQFSEAEVTAIFDIAATSIYLEDSLGVFVTGVY